MKNIFILTMPGEENHDKSDSEDSISSLVTSSSDRSHGERADLRKKKAFFKSKPNHKGVGGHIRRTSFLKVFFIVRRGSARQIR